MLVKVFLFFFNLNVKNVCDTLCEEVWKSLVEKINKKLIILVTIKIKLCRKILTYPSSNKCSAIERPLTSSKKFLKRFLFFSMRNRCQHQLSKSFLVFLVFFFPLENHCLKLVISVFDCNDAHVRLTVDFETCAISKLEIFDKFVLVSKIDFHLAWSALNRYTIVWRNRKIL